MRAPMMVIFAIVAAGTGFAAYRVAMHGTQPVSAPAQAPPVLHKGHGFVTGVSAPDGYLELRHDPIASMKWGAMQMGFAVADKKLLEGLKKGDEVEFEMRGLPNQAGDFVVERLTRKDKPSPR